MRIYARGDILIILLISISIILVIEVSLTTLYLRAVNSCNIKKEGLKVFYLAEAGIEKAKCNINNGVSWNTDPPHSENDKRWLISGSIGQTVYCGSGGFKIIKENGKTYLYSVGFIGNDILKSRSYCFQKIAFEIPYKLVKWEKF